MARLVPCLERLRADFDALAPGRDRASDGWIGDPAHAARRSDHNPDGRGLVHAIDVDEDLGVPGLTMEAVVQHLLARCRAGLERRLTYVIYERRIWEASNGWRQRTYTGANPHDHHAHFSAGDAPARENDARTWTLEEIPVALTEADKDWIRAEIRKVVTSDADPGPRDYSLGGLITTIERRTADDDARFDNLTATLGRIETTLSEVVRDRPAPA